MVALWRKYSEAVARASNEHDFEQASGKREADFKAWPYVMLAARSAIMQPSRVR